MTKRVTVLLSEPDKYCSLAADGFSLNDNIMCVYRSGKSPDGTDDEMVGWFSEGTYKAVYVTESNGEGKR